VKRTKKLIALVVILCLLVIGYFTIAIVIDWAESLDLSVSVSSIDTDSITALSWTKDGETIELLRKDGVWQNAADPLFPVDQDSGKISAMLSAIASVTASKEIKSPSADLSGYGLDIPSRTIMVQNSDGSKSVYAIGKTSSVAGAYYMQYSNSTSVFLVDDSLLTPFNYGLYDLLLQETIPYITAVRSFTVDSDYNKLKMVYLEDTESITYSDKYLWFLLDENNTYLPLKIEQVQQVHNNIMQLKWERCIEYNASPQQLEQFGLDTPRLTVTTQYLSRVTSDTGQVDASGNPLFESTKQLTDFTLMIGNYYEDYCYAKLALSNMVYLISADAADNLLSAKYEDLRPTAVCLMDWNSVDSMDITISSNEHYTIEFNSDATGTQYVSGGAALDSTAVQGLLSAIYGLSSIGDAENPAVSDTPEIAIVFHRNTEYFSEMTLTLSKYDGDSYLVDFDGESRLLVKKSKITTIKELIANIFSA